LCDSSSEVVSQINWLTQMEVVPSNTSLDTEGIYANEVEPQPEDVTNGDASAPGSLGGPYWDLVASGPGLSPPRDAGPGDMILAPGSSDIVDPGAAEKGLPGYPGALSPPTNRRQVEGSAELACSQVAITG
jgi:hypothetical protein